VSAPAVSDRTHVYTNEDLQNYGRPSDPRANTAAAEKSLEDEKTFEKNALAHDAKQKEAEADWARQQADAEVSVRIASDRLDELKRQRLADANPLLPQPKLKDEEQAARQGEPRDRLVKDDQEQIKQAEANLQEARDNLDKVRTQRPPDR
jgi:hypothetical protein